MTDPDSNPTQKQLNEIIRKLNRRNIVTWLPEMKWGKPVYEYLKTALVSDEVNANQTRNIMHALFRLRFHGDSEEVMRLYMRFVDDDRLKVRSKAIQLAVGLSALYAEYPRLSVPLKPEDRHRIEAALNRGVDTQTAMFARDILGKGETDSAGDIDDP